jgi:hypothetical protein
MPRFAQNSALHFTYNYTYNDRPRGRRWFVTPSLTSLTSLTTTSLTRGGA